MWVIRERLRYIWVLLRERVWERWVALAWLAYGILVAFRDEVPKPEDAERWRVSALIPHLSVAWWVAVALVILAAWLFEASFKHQRHANEDYRTLKEKHDALNCGPTLSFDPADNYLDSDRARHFKIAVTNTTGAYIEACQLVVRTTWSDESHERPGEEQAMTEPFDLKMGQTVSQPFLEIQEGRETNGVSIVNFTLYQSFWDKSVLTPMLRPGTYLLRVIALSKNAPASSLDLKLEHAGEWNISCA